MALGTLLHYYDVGLGNCAMCLGGLSQGQREGRLYLPCLLPGVLWSRTAGDGLLHQGDVA